MKRRMKRQVRNKAEEAKKKIKDCRHIFHVCVLENYFHTFHRNHMQLTSIHYQQNCFANFLSFIKQNEFNQSLIISVQIEIII